MKILAPWFILLHVSSPWQQVWSQTVNRSWHSLGIFVSSSSSLLPNPPCQFCSPSSPWVYTSLTVKGQPTPGGRVFVQRVGAPELISSLTSANYWTGQTARGTGAVQRGGDMKALETSVFTENKSKHMGMSDIWIIWVVDLREAFRLSDFLLLQLKTVLINVKTTVGWGKYW